MEIFGIGGMELVAIFIIMLVVAGPKRMTQWAFTMGQYLSKLKNMWKSVAGELQREFDQAGVDFKVPEQVPTRANLTRSFNRQMNQVMSPVTKPIQESLKETRIDLKPVQDIKPQPLPAAPKTEVQDLGVWSQRQG